MKNIATCYSETAIKVSDSYCSGPSSQAFTSSHLTPSIQNAVTCIYKVKLSTRKQFLIRLTWCNLLKHGFSIVISDYPISSAKISKNTKIICSERGSENFESCGLRIEVFWDLSHAKYESGPEPITGFYVVVLVSSEPSLILGDMEQELDVKKCVSDMEQSMNQGLKRSLDFTLISRREHYSGNAVYSTKTKFSDTGTCHDILIKCFGQDRTTLKNPILSVYIDKKNVIQMNKLQWKFRGNQTIFLDGLLVDFMWDVYDWLFGPSSSGYAVFLFRTRRGLDSRLWLEEKNFEHNEQEKVGFSFLICACKNPD